MEINLDIKGLDEVEKALKNLGAETGAKELRGALRDAAKPAWEEMVNNAPVFSKSERVVYYKYKGVRKNPNGKGWLLDSAGLKNSIRRRGKINKDGSKGRFINKNTAAVVTVGSRGIFYAHMIEFGTKKIKARPFIRPAVENNSVEAIRIFHLRIQKRIKNAEKRIARKNKNR